MKILFFIDAFSAGGKERRLTELMKALKQSPGIEFALVVMNKDVHYKELFDLDITIHYIIRKTKKDLSVFRQVYKLCKILKPDIIHCWDSMTAVYVLPAVRLLKIKFVNGMVVDAPRVQNIRNKNWFRARLTFPFSHMIVGNSTAGLKAYGAPGKKSICIHNGFNFQRIKNIAVVSTMREQLQITTKYAVGMVASFSEFKDYATYYKAAHLLLARRQDITFLAIGNETDSAVSKNLAGNEYAPYFRLLGKKSDIESYINMMDVCVLSTFTEGISNSILEYMAIGKPVIATQGGGTGEIVQDGKTGYLIPASNPELLSEKIQILLNDQKLRNEMGEAGQQCIREHFSITKMVKEFIESYNHLLTKK